MAYFLDASALVKYYVTEPGSTWVRQRVDEEQSVLLAEITVAELAAALGILQRVGRTYRLVCCLTLPNSLISPLITLY